MRHNKTKRMMEYWLTLHAGANAGRTGEFGNIWPERSDIQPSACPDILGDMFILDINNIGCRYRLAGTRLCAMHGRELKNERFYNSYEKQDQRTAENWVLGLGQEDYAVLICADTVNRNGNMLPVETLLMPLNHHGVSGRRALGITVPLDNPTWLGSVDVKEQTIRSVRVLRPWEDANTQNARRHNLSASASPFDRRKTASAPALSPSTAPVSHYANYEHPALEETAVPYLRVLNGGKQ